MSYQIGSRVWTDLGTHRVGSGPSTSLNVTSGTGAAVSRKKITFTQTKPTTYGSGDVKNVVAASNKL